MEKRIAALLDHLAEAAPLSRPDAPKRTFVHVFYGGVYLFRRETLDKLARIARTSFEQHSAGCELFADAKVRARVKKKLEGPTAIEAMCIDFEDGYGERSDAEEDADAVRTANELAALPEGGPVVGIRIKSLAPATAKRAVRTLESFVGAAKPRAGFSVTLPKVARAAEVRALTEILAILEETNGIPQGRIRVELMIETPRALFHERELVDAAGGRCIAVHLGAYDLSSSLDINATEQRLDHPLCDLARLEGRVALADLDVLFYDGATTVLPIGESDAVHRAWTLHAGNVRRAIDFGIFQGWDLHPAQLPARYAALYGYFLPRHDEMKARLDAFRERQERATRNGQVFDDAATARGLENFFRRGTACGAFDT